MKTKKKLINFQLLVKSHCHKTVVFTKVSDVLVSHEKKNKYEYFLSPIVKKKYIVKLYQNKKTERP